jgi:uncharacterized repeat protein (TIGR03803 family)
MMLDRGVVAERRILGAWCALWVTVFLAGCGGGGGHKDTGGVQTYSLGGTIAGLGDASGLVLADGLESVAIPAGSTGFSFPTPLSAGAEYSITVATQPTGETCTVAGGSGTIGSANIANAVVTCSDRSYTVGGTISGLTVSGLVLANGMDTLPVSAGATTFTMPTALAYTSSYSITVKTQPSGLACAVTNGSGTMPAGNLTNVAVTCSGQPFTLSGSIRGLGNNTGLVLANGSDTLNVSAGASTFSMPAAVPFGSPYSVVVQSAPAGLTCTVINGSGTMPASNVSNVTITCADQSYTIGGSVMGLHRPGLMLANGTDILSVPANATSFTMPASIAFGSSYAVTVQAQPDNTTCTVGNGSGVVGARPVTNITVTCSQDSFTVGGSITGLTVAGLVLASGTDTLQVLANAATFTLPASFANGASYNVTVKTHPTAVNCVVTNGSGTINDADVTNINIACGPGTEVLLSPMSATLGNTPNYGALIQANDGNLYGVASYGGDYNGGTFFKLTPSGDVTVIWSFGAGMDGQRPTGRPVQGSDGTFYGTTANGGQYGYGTVFKITPAGTESVLWSFGSGSDARYPNGYLLQASDGNLYGMSNSGGTSALGTVFKITLSGTESVLWSFAGGGDGSQPFGGLIQASDGNLYGTTWRGGTSSVAPAGTVFRLTLSGTETVIHSFGDAGDGVDPTSGTLLQASDGYLYGMTYQGGANDLGTVFKIDPTSGSELIFYSFNVGPDAAHPDAGLIQANDGNFYGTTTQGGTSGNGTIFKLTPSGTETVLSSFAGVGPDGYMPEGNLVQADNGSLYGLANAGGANGDGAIFELN